jgi:putative hydrolase of the HAD superfamily
MKPDFIFDFGAVVFRWQPLALMQEVLPERATDEAAAQRLVQAVFQGYGGAWGAFDRGELEGDALVAALVGQSGLSAAEVRRLIAAVPDHLEPLTETVAWLHELQQAGHRLFYLSNMPRPFADELERRHGFLNLFEGGLFSGRAGLSKPDAAIFRQILDQFSLQAARTVFLDDHLPNIDAARALGIRAIAFQNAAQARAELLASGGFQRA